MKNGQNLSDVLMRGELRNPRKIKMPTNPRKVLMPQDPLLNKGKKSMQPQNKELAQTQDNENDAIQADIRELPLMLKAALSERDALATRLTHSKARIALLAQSLEFCKLAIKKLLNCDLDKPEDYQKLAEKLEITHQDDTIEIPDAQIKVN